MNNIEEIIEAIAIALAVATLLLNTGRALKAIELCKESLIMLNDKMPSIKQQLAKQIYEKVYETIFDGYYRIHDNANAITYGRKLLVIYCESGMTVPEGYLSIKLAQIYENQNKYTEAKELYERTVTIMKEIGNKKEEKNAYEKLGTVYRSLGNYVKAKEYFEKALAINMETGDRAGEAACCSDLGTVCESLGDFLKAKEYLEKALAITMEIGDRAGEEACYSKLGTVFQLLGDYVKAKEYHEKALAINIEIGDRQGEAACYSNLGIVFRLLSDYVKAKEYHEKALAITVEFGDRQGEAACYSNLGTVFLSLGDKVKAKEYLEKALAITVKIGDRQAEAACYANLGSVFKSLGDYVKAKEYLEKALAMTMEIGDRAGEAACYSNLGTVFQLLGDYVKAKEYHEKALAITMEIDDLKREATCYSELGTVFQLLGDYVKAKEYHEKALAITVKIGHRGIEAACYGNLGTVFQMFGEYVKAKECFEKRLAIETETGNRAGVAECYGLLGTMFLSLGEEYANAKEYFEKALKIVMEIGDRSSKAVYYRYLGVVYQHLRKYRKSKEYLEKSLKVHVEIGRKDGIAAYYHELGNFFKCLGDNKKAKEYFEKALAMFIEIGNRQGEAAVNAELGRVFQSLGEYVKAEEYFEKAISISKDIKDANTEYQSYCYLTLTKLSQEQIQEAFSCLFQSIEKSEDLRGLNADNDEIKVSLADRHAFSYGQLSGLFCDKGNYNNGLYVAELGRARALADLMATQYSTETHISADPQSWIGLENVMTKESNCTCLYISYHSKRVLLWILKASGAISFRELTVDKNTLYKTLAQPAEDLDEFFATIAKSFRKLNIMPKDVYEAALRPAKDEEDLKPSLTLLHEMLINPVSDLLEEPEVIIVPHRNLCSVPFAALLDKNGKYLSETFRIRIIPSLTTLKLIQDSPADYHSPTGALIVGDPEVGDVIYNGRPNEDFVPLPGARKEAEMIGRLLGEQPLLGKEATKQAVLQRLSSVSLIHFAAHGSAERGEIALAPQGSTTEIPQEDDYLLKMTDISKVQLRAKLVVLRCCHSGLGQIRAEGAVGIARAFLGSGARSVLVALWALDDSATKQLMSCFYEHLVRGESASESLHEAMKWMRDMQWLRGNSVTMVSDWAPFILIGDNVTFDFRKKN